MAMTAHYTRAARFDARRQRGLVSSTRGGHTLSVGETSVSNALVKAPKPPLLDRIGWYFLELVGIVPEARLATLPSDNVLDRAELEIRGNRGDKAREMLEHAARRPLDDPRTLERLAQLELRNGNPAAARRSQIRSAQAYLRRGLVNEGAAVLRQILVIHRDFLEARLALGQLSEGRGETEEAVAQYVESVKILTARKDWSGAQELVERIRQLQRVKTILDGVTEISDRVLHDAPHFTTEDQHTVVSGGPVARTQPPPSWQQGPSVWVSPELAAGGPTRADAPPTRLFVAPDPPGAVPRTYGAVPTDIVIHKPAAGTAGNTVGSLNMFNIPLATAVEYRPDAPGHAGAMRGFDFELDETLRPGMLDAAMVARAAAAAEPPHASGQPQPPAMPNEAAAGARASKAFDHHGLPPGIDPELFRAATAPTNPGSTGPGSPEAPRRSGSVWDRAIIRVEPQEITLAIEQEVVRDTGPLEPSVLSRTKTGIQNAISGIFAVPRPGGTKSGKKP
jgi:hypothetical protein